MWPPAPRSAKPPAPRRPLSPLAKLTLTDEVSRTLFAEFAQHRRTERGDEETGWTLLGYRDGDEALAVATLPAGAERHASQGHVRFNSTAQAFASRLVRGHDKRLTLLGVVHTHPGSLRHPSDGDYRGDVRWVGQLRGGEGVFGIGTVEGKIERAGVAWQPQPHQQCLDDMRWSWYCLGEHDRTYRALPVAVTLGPDLAQELRPVWDVIEAHGQRLDNLARSLTRVSFAVTEGPPPGVVVTAPGPDAETAIRVSITAKEVRYLVFRDGSALTADLPESRVDHGVYLLLAELAAQS